LTNRFIKWVNSIRKNRREAKEFYKYYYNGKGLIYSERKLYDMLIADVCCMDEEERADYNARYKRKYFKVIPGGNKS